MRAGERLPRRPPTGRCLGVLLLTLAAAPAAGAQQLTFTPLHAGGVYAVGEPVGWTVGVAPGDTAAKGSYTYTIRRDGLAVIRTGTFDLASGSATIETTLARPGMVLVEVRPPAGAAGFHGASKAEVGRALVGAAVAPTRIRPSAPRPADFDAFWAARIRQLDSIPADPLLTAGPSDRQGVEYFTIRMNNVHGSHVYGQLARPAGEGKFPALVIFQWASPPYPLQEKWVTDRAAEGWLVLNVEPHDVPGDMPQAFYDALPAIIKNYPAIGEHSRDRSYFLRMYLGDYRAVSYMAGRSDWDGRTLVVMGISMGGQQSFAVAGLNPKVTDMLVDVPAGCDVSGPLHGRASPYPFWDMRQPEIRRTAVYFDSDNFAPRITARALVAFGLIDEISPPAGVWAAYNEIRGPKEAVPMVDSPHNHLATPEEQEPWTRRSAEWLDALVHGRDPLAAHAGP